MYFHVIGQYSASAGTTAYDSRDVQLGNITTDYEVRLMSPQRQMCVYIYMCVYVFFLVGDNRLIYIVSIYCHPLVKMKFVRIICHGVLIKHGE